VIGSYVLCFHRSGERRLRVRGGRAERTVRVRVTIQAPPQAKQTPEKYTVSKREHKLWIRRSWNIDFGIWHPIIGGGGGLKSAACSGLETSRFSLLCPGAADARGEDRYREPSGCSYSSPFGFARAKTAPRRLYDIW